MDDKKRMPVIFTGHGDPMIALRDDGITRELKKIGNGIIKEYGKPKAILAISAHWYTRGSFVQTAEEPRQIYDMYGFPQELYEVRYPAKGSARLSGRVMDLLGKDVLVNDSWGIDHGAWSVLVHLFPKADIPVVQLSVDGTIDTRKIYEIGRRLAPLRKEGYLFLGSGNVVHNLRRVEWDNPGGTEMTHAFNDMIIDSVKNGEPEKVIAYKNAPDADYAVPTPEHFLPLVYCLGASGGDRAEVFNNVCNLGSMAMTGFIFHE